MKEEEKAKSLLELKHGVYLTYFEIIVISLISFGIIFWFGFNLSDQIATLAVKLIVVVLLITAVIVIHYITKNKRKENKKPNRSKLRGFLVFAGKSIPSQQAVGISTQQTIKFRQFYKRKQKSSSYATVAYTEEASSGRARVVRCYSRHSRITWYCADSVECVLVEA